MLKFLVLFAAYAGLLYILPRLFKDFVVSRQASLWAMALVLVVIDALARFFLWPALAVADIIPIIDILFPLFVNVLIFWVTDKLMKSFDIKSVPTLIFSAIALAAANAAVQHLMD